MNWLCEICDGYTILTTTMYGGTAYDNAEAAARDQMINALKKELYDLQDREHDYLNL